MSELTPKRRWFRWSLRTLFVVVTAICVALGYQWNWIQQRHRALESGIVEAWGQPDSTGAIRVAEAPGILWLFGESGYPSLMFEVTDSSFRLSDTESLRYARMQRLFPEAVIDLTLTEPRPASGSSSGSPYDGAKF
ncbi:MAG: hypothetical protein AB7O59_24070 [Pirellulales bacterium]